MVGGETEVQMSDITWEIKDYSDQVKKATAEQLEKALIAVAIEAEKKAKLELGNAPKRIDTGLLRNSITYAVAGQGPAISSYKGDNPSRYGGRKGIPSGSYSGTAPSAKQGEKVVYVGTNVKYALRVHEGEGKMAPNRFLRNACENNTEKFKEIFIDQFRGF